MEAKYSKLHDKFTKLKSEKEAEIESINLDQEVKFMDYKTAADELIEHLRNENSRLHSQIIELEKMQNDKIRDAPNYHCRSSGADLHGEPKGNRNETNVQDQDLRKEGSHQNAGKDNNKAVMSGSAGVESDSVVILNSDSKKQKRLRGNTPGESDATDILKSNSTRKPSRRHLGTAEKVAITRSASGHAPEAASDSTSDELRQNPLFGIGSHIHQPACCKRMQDLSGNGVNAGGTANCVFHDLIERLLGMNLSASIQADGICISALHQLSGYSFRLTLVDKVSGGEAELVYDPISLGTFEMGAPEWMKEVIIFSKFMSPVFFERVLRVIK